MKFKLWMLVIMVLCVSLWLVTRHGIPSEYNEISKHPFSHGYVPEANRVDDTSVKLGIQCVGAGPHEAEDLFCMERPQYLPDFKNPCWYAKEDGKLRLKCVPYFHLLGVCKSGTTDLAYRIRAHEDVLGCNDCRGKKECFYWCRRRYDSRCRQDEHDEKRTLLKSPIDILRMLFINCKYTGRTPQDYVFCRDGKHINTALFHHDKRISFSFRDTSEGLGEDDMASYEWSMKERTPCNFSCFQHMFADATQKIEQTTTETGYHNMITGDATPSDFSDFRGWPKIPQNVGSEKPVVMTPHLMRHVYTDPKFILIFRNPTERLYSDYTMRGGRSAVAFHEAVRRDIQTQETCMKNHTVEQCLYSLEIAQTLRTRIFLGCYSVYMREWLKVFPRNQFLILRTEDHDEDPKSQIRKVYNYLKLNYTEDWLSFIANVPHQHVSQKKIRQGPMLEKTRVLLDNFYSRYKQDLSNILQDKRFLWLT